MFFEIQGALCMLMHICDSPAKVWAILNLNSFISCYVSTVPNTGFCTVNKCSFIEHYLISLNIFNSYYALGLMLLRIYIYKTIDWNLKNPVLQTHSLSVP